MELLRLDWPAPVRVQAMVTTRAFGDASREETRRKLGGLVPAEPIWLQQVHGTRVIEAGSELKDARADAAVAHRANTVCAVMAADCMPVLLADDQATAVAAAHAGWRGLCAGGSEATFAGMGVQPSRTLAWLGPAIGPRVYEIGKEVRDAFIARDANSASAFVATRPGHWLLDLYAVARQRLAALGIERVYGGGFCTYSDKERFFSYRRDRATERMAALIWLTGVESRTL